MPKGCLFIVSAPSGAGKTTIISEIRRQYPDLLYSISCTTRRPRPGEIDGIHYFFLSRDNFEKMIQEGKFLEWKEVHGNLYGTPIEPIKFALAEHKHVILDIDVQGAKEVIGKIPEVVTIFISAPDTATLESRLRKRGTDSEDIIKLRLSNAVTELNEARFFQFKIINNELSSAVREFAGIIDHYRAEAREGCKLGI